MTHRPGALLPLLLLLCLLGPLGGCTGLEVALGVEGTSDAVFGRGIADLGVSAFTGRDCSTVRLDKGLPYCAPRGTLPAPPPFCTRTIGTVTCWQDPEHLNDQPGSVADTPDLTAEQKRLITARWPASLNLND